MFVEDLMIRDAVTIHKEDTVKQLIEVLIKHRIDGVPVVDRERRLVGFASDGDVLRAVAPNPKTVYKYYTMMATVQAEKLQQTLRRAMSKKVKDVMKRRGLQVVYPGQELDAILKILTHHRFKKIPVVDSERRVVGVVSRSDVIRYLGTLAIEEVG